MPKFKNTIFNQLFLTLIGISLSFIIVILIIYYGYSSRLLESDLRNEIDKIQQSHVKLFEASYLNPLENVLSMLSISTTLAKLGYLSNEKKTLVRFEIEREFQQIIRLSQSKYRSIRFIDSHGNENVVIEGNKRIRQYSSYAQNKQNKQNKRFKQLFQQLENSELGSVQHLPLTQLDNGNYSFLAGKAISEPDIGGFGGTIIIEIDLSQFQHSTEQLSYQGVMLAHIAKTNQSLKDSQLNSSLPVKFNGHSKTPLFYMEFKVPHQIIEKKLDAIVYSAILILITAFIVFYLIAKFLTQKLTTPIHRLINATSGIALGNYSINLEEKLGFSELDELAADFNKMSRAILNHNKEITSNKNELNAIIESIPQMIFVKEIEELRFIKLNQAGEKLLGTSSEDMIGKNDYDLFPKEQADFFTKKDREVIQLGNVITIEEEPIDTPQGKRILHTRKVLINNAQGTPEYLLGISEDITEKKQSEERFQFITKHSPDMIYQMSLPDGKYEFVSPASVRVFGYSPEEWYQEDKIIEKIIHPDWHQYFENEWVNLTTTGKVPHTYEYQIIHKDGRTRWVHQRNFINSDAEGKPTVIIGVASDITERKELELNLKLSEQRLKDIIESSNDWVWEVDAQGRYIYVSDDTIDILGYSKEEILGKTPFDFMPPEELNNAEEFFSNILSEKKTFNDFENINLHKDGYKVILSTSGIPVLDEHGELLGYRGTDRDITDKVEYKIKLEQEVKDRTIELNKEKEKAVLATRAKSEFLANMSHELRTPMHGIISYSNMGIKRFHSANDEKKLRYFNNIKISADRLLLLLNDLLDLAKLEAGKMVLEFKKYQLKSICDMAIIEQKARLEENSLEVVYAEDCSEGIGAFDHLRIAQVITNLLSNAIKFSPKNERIDISIKNTTIQIEELGQSVPAFCLSMKDNGNGIPENELELVFNHFEQGSQKNTGTTKGTGLGLPICREIIELHHGKIWAKNHPDGGAKFSFIIPAQQAETFNDLTSK